MIRLLVTMGDPSGIGPEVLLKSLSRLLSLRLPKFRFVSQIETNRGGENDLPLSLSVIGDRPYLEALARRLRLKVRWDRFSWIEGDPVPVGLRPGKVQASAGKAAYRYLLEAVRRIKKGEADALVTAPVSKEAITQAGIRWIGHTEFLGDSFGCRPVMMFVTNRFRVSLVTTHLSVRELPKRITRSGVLQTLRLTWESLMRDFGTGRPRIGLAALNPHAGEGGLFGREEKQILLPVVRQLNRSSDSAGVVEGPLSADSLIQAASQGRYDAIVALYHDQALIPVKLIGWQEAVNVTLGLPFVRTSPVHGTAFDLAGKGKADPRSMTAALRLAIQLTHRRAQQPRH
jgi:4-hydroxythreonine-4-phosphate dehydrogenase